MDTVKRGKREDSLYSSKMGKAKGNSDVRELVKRIKNPEKKLISDNLELKEALERVRIEIKKAGLMGKKELIIA